MFSTTSLVGELVAAFRAGAEGVVGARGGEIVFGFEGGEETDCSRTSRWVIAETFEKAVDERGCRVVFVFRDGRSRSERAFGVAVSCFPRCFLVRHRGFRPVRGRFRRPRQVVPDGANGFVL